MKQLQTFNTVCIWYLTNVNAVSALFPQGISCLAVKIKASTIICKYSTIFFISLMTDCKGHLLSHICLMAFTIAEFTQLLGFSPVWKHVLLALLTRELFKTVEILFTLNHGKYSLLDWSLVYSTRQDAVLDCMNPELADRVREDHYRSIENCFGVVQQNVQLNKLQEQYQLQTHNVKSFINNKHWSSIIGDVSTFCAQFFEILPEFSTKSKFRGCTCIPSSHTTASSWWRAL